MSDRAIRPVAIASSASVSGSVDPFGGASAGPAGRARRAPTGMRQQPVRERVTEPAIALKAWNPKTPYLKKLRAASASKRWSVYLAERKKHGLTPGFFLDCADFFRGKKQPELALQVLSNLAELELENPALLRVLAHRLAQLDHLDLAILTFDEVRKLRPEEPQSFRDLALVLARRADRDAAADRNRKRVRSDYGRALELLSKVVMEEWDRFDEIEVIALTELNNIRTKAKHAGAKLPALDRRLIKPLDMDVRIVMSWDADSTDMDLHVVEPSREEASYEHNRTTIGGMVTRDFTDGYGPEVYLVRRGMRGTYKIKTNYYGSSAAKLTGAVTLQVDVFTNYGRSNEKRKSMTLRLKKKKDTFEVGEIEI